MKYMVFVLLVALLACGSGRDPRLSQSNQPNARQLTISGFVSTVQTAVAGTSQGSNSTVTMVTFEAQTPQAGPIGTVTFCGDVTQDFVVNTFATAKFTQGQGCSKLISVTT